MAGGVDSPSHAADNHPALRCQAAAALRDCPEPITPSAGGKFLLAVVDNKISSRETIVTPYRQREKSPPAPIPQTFP
jgi:hypothetical protein